MDSTEHESAGENDDYQGVSDSTMMNAELDALLDPDSDTDNPTQKKPPLVIKELIRLASWILVFYSQNYGRSILNLFGKFPVQFGRSANT